MKKTGRGLELDYKTQRQHEKFSLARAQAPAQTSSQVFRPLFQPTTSGPPESFEWCQAATARRHFHDYKQRTWGPRTARQHFEIEAAGKGISMWMYVCITMRGTASDSEVLSSQIKDLAPTTSKPSSKWTERLLAHCQATEVTKLNEMD